MHDCMIHYLIKKIISVSGCTLNPIYFELIAVVHNFPALINDNYSIYGAPCCLLAHAL